MLLRVGEDWEMKVVGKFSIFLEEYHPEKCRLRGKFVIILFVLIFSQKVFVATAKSDYTESIQLWIDVSPSMNCEATVMFSFSGLSRPLNFVDFQSEPSFLGLQISTTYIKGLESTSVFIDLNGSKVSTDKGRFIADTMTYELERDLRMLLLMPSIPAYYSPSPGELEFRYESNFSSVEFRDIFLESLPSQGFAQILALMLSKNQNCSMHVGLGKEGGWSVRFYCDGGTEKLVPNEEQTISLKEITGYSGNIVSASASSSSTLSIMVLSQIGREYDLTISSVSPTQMQGVYQEGMPQYQSYYEAKGISVEDLSVSLKIVLSSILLTALIVAAQITIVVVSIIVIKRHKPTQKY
jgi:hypothetical protein